MRAGSLQQISHSRMAIPSTSLHGVQCLVCVLGVKLQLLHGYLEKGKNPKPEVLIHGHVFVIHHGALPVFC